MPSTTSRKVEQSRRLQQRAESMIPGGVNSPVRAFGSVGGDPPLAAWAAAGASPSAQAMTTAAPVAATRRAIRGIGLTSTFRVSPTR